jgi:hypothetical protein
MIYPIPKLLRESLFVEAYPRPLALAIGTGNALAM